MLSRDVTAVEQAEVMRRDFVANVSHEIRTPLTVLAGFVETLQTLDLAARGAHALPADDGPAGAAHADAGERPADAVAAGGQPAARRGRMDAVRGLLLAQCEQEARALADDARARSSTLRFAPAPTLAIAGVPSELQSAFSNLVSNAVRYTPGRRQRSRCVARG